MPKSILYILACFCLYQVNGQDTQPQEEKELSLLFIGDIMGHQSQINAAFDDNTGQYNYDTCFKYIAPILSKADVTIANLEVTLAGWPYSGYPQFSSPDELAVAMKNAGVDVMVTANNHSCDRRKVGLERTIAVLDSLEIKHTGTFLDAASREKEYPLLIEKNGFRIALLNYTYATNGIPASPPNIVNLINKETILKDLAKARSINPDHIVVFMHWGLEYKQYPSKQQVSFYNLCKNNGADMIIGSHPHVVQKMEFHADNENPHLVAYSLGNFISNQRTSPRDGGAILQVNLHKRDSVSRVKNAGYYLTWVYPPKINQKKKFYVLPISKFENIPTFFDNASFLKMKTFAEGSRKLFEAENKHVEEYKYNPEQENYYRIEVNNE
ncbi:CapA family protein [Fulvivirgaceae bacterium BMA12]|uniref:CapA family protein n=1 Tax=Agaribacillus aureus TaxID=3051825 RepID=A0ABT8L9E2_9BACT|nr:CapA family protein [Fulvivirgaceae bacterium BMA12]